MTTPLTSISGQGQQAVLIARQIGSLTATIPSGQAQSDIVDLHGGVLVALLMPAAWTAAAISFLASATKEGTFLPVFDDAGAEVTIASANVAASRVIANSTVLEKLAALRFIKIRSGVSTAEVNQGAERVLTLLTKG